MMRLINDYKTYIGFIAIGVIPILAQFGWISEELFNTLMPIAYGWTGIAAAHKGNKLIRAVRAKNGKK